jgi:hypothetical protein
VVPLTAVDDPIEGVAVANAGDHAALPPVAVATRKRVAGERAQTLGSEEKLDGHDRLAV